MRKILWYIFIVFTVLVAILFLIAQNIAKTPESSIPEFINTEQQTEEVVAGKSDLIRVFNPPLNTLIKNPLEIRGEARGYWFFEASFPARLVDENGTQLAIIPIQAMGEWMTPEFVLFQGTMNFSTPTTQRGVLILEKDNPSGLPEHADELQIPVRFW